MKIICAGLSKTGTKSLTGALRTLGYTVYDYTESVSYHIQQWHDIALKNKTPDFVSMYSDVDAVVDVPSNHFYEEIFEAFPDAKVILTVRDNEDAWVKSLVNYAKRLRRNRKISPLWLAVRVSPTYRFVRQVIYHVWIKKFGSLVKTESLHYETCLNETRLKEIYRKHNEEVKQSIPAGQLLVYNVREGWGPLCDFLKLEKPSAPFPHLNKDAEILNTLLPQEVVYEVGATIIKETVLIFSVLIVFISVLVYWCATV